MKKSICRLCLVDTWDDEHLEGCPGTEGDVDQFALEMGKMQPAVAAALAKESEASSIRLAVAMYVTERMKILTQHNLTDPETKARIDEVMKLNDKFFPKLANTGKSLGGDGPGNRG